MNLLKKAVNAIKTKIYWKTYSFFIDKTFEPKISYSQNGEDIIVRGIFESLSKKRIFYLEAGGYHPYNGSNTALFYLTGSSGIVIEPNPGLFSAFPLKRPRDISLNIGISTRSGTQPFYRSVSGALSGFMTGDENEFRESGKLPANAVTVQVMTLPEIISEYTGGKTIDFLSLDIEGMELAVLQTLDFRKGAPMVLCIETLRHTGSRNWEKSTDIIDFLTANGYLVYADTHINTIFVRRDVMQ